MQWRLRSLQEWLIVLMQARDYPLTVLCFIYSAACADRADAKALVTATGRDGYSA